MNVLPGYPKVLQLHTAGKFLPPDATVSGEITEKLDGSQFAFGVIGGKLMFRSKNAPIDPDNPNPLFAPAVEHVLKHRRYLVEGCVYYGEAFRDKKHNTISYLRPPAGHIYLFAVRWVERPFPTEILSEDLRHYALPLRIDYARPLYTADRIRFEDLVAKLRDIVDEEPESYLGGDKIEGAVLKVRGVFSMWGQVYDFIQFKYVREQFKERNRENWKTPKQNWETFCNSFKNEARWKKAVQHLREQGQLEFSPRDIGKIVKEVQRDIVEEEWDEIVAAMKRFFLPQLLKTSTKGLAEWYKKKLLEEMWT